MINEAKANEEADKKRKEDVDLRNEADTLVFSVRKSLEEYGDKVTEDEKNNINSKATELEEALKGQDINAIKTKKEELEKAAQGLAQKVYEEESKKNQGGGTNNDNNQGGNSGADQDIFDADYKEV